MKPDPAKLPSHLRVFNWDEVRYDERGLPPMDTEAGWLYWRHKARTNLYFLCRWVLGYTDVTWKVHGQLISNLQKFRGGVDSFVFTKTPRGLAVKMDAEHKGYTPHCTLWELKGSRRSLNLIPRGHLKTTIATIAFTIQWLVNYPDIRILLSAATDSQVKKFLSEIRSHFQFNETFRYLFPEYCPQGKNVKEFGNQEQFTVPNRKLHRKEPSISTVTIGSVMAGGHFEVIIHDDIVDKENVRTPDQMATVKSHVGMMGPLLETSEVAPHTGWVVMTGTRYHFGDLYGDIIGSERKLKETGQPTVWSVVNQSALVSGGLFDDDAQVLWPERVPLSRLREIYNDPTQGPGVLASQYLQDPRPDGTGLIENENQLVWIPRKIMNELEARLSIGCTVDLAGMEPNRAGGDNDYSVLTVYGFGRDGSLYILKTFRGRFNVFQVIEYFFQIYKEFPRLRWFKVEKEANARVLLPFLKREMARRNVWLPILEIKRDNRTSKEQRIKGLQPWFHAGNIRFAEDLACKIDLVNEILGFPKYPHDDILDTLADSLQDRDGGVTAEVTGRPAQQQQMSDYVFDKLRPEGTLVTVPGARVQDADMFNDWKQLPSGVDPVTGL
jgi:predicted phage terminase large subunit-like protein